MFYKQHRYKQQLVFLSKFKGTALVGNFKDKEHIPYEKLVNSEKKVTFRLILTKCKDISE